MKNIITAIGNEELNKILSVASGIKVATQDIQYQDGILEALDKYDDIDIVIIKEGIIGDLELEDLISSITMIKNDIQIILIVKQEQTFSSKHIIKQIDETADYISIVTAMFTDGCIPPHALTPPKPPTPTQTPPPAQGLSITIAQTKKRLNFAHSRRPRRRTFTHKLTQTKRHDIITFIRAGRDRQDYDTFLTCETHPKTQSTTHRFRPNVR